MQMTRRFDLITFDLDGTMLDDEWAHREANRRMGQRLGIDHTQLGPMTGYPVRMRWQNCADVRAVIWMWNNWRRSISAWRWSHKGGRDPGNSGPDRHLRTLKEDGYSIAVVSSSTEWFVREVTDLLGLTSYLDFFVTQNQVQRLKPDPESYLTAQRLAGVPAHRHWASRTALPAVRLCAGQGCTVSAF